MLRAELGVQEQQYLICVVAEIRLVVGWNRRCTCTLRILGFRHALLDGILRNRRPTKGCGLGTSNLMHWCNILKCSS